MLNKKERKNMPRGTRDKSRAKWRFEGTNKSTEQNLQRATRTLIPTCSANKNQFTSRNQTDSLQAGSRSLPAKFPVGSPGDESTRIEISNIEASQDMSTKGHTLDIEMESQEQSQMTGWEEKKDETDLSHIVESQLGGQAISKAPDQAKVSKLISSQFEIMMASMKKEMKKCRASLRMDISGGLNENIRKKVKEEPGSDKTELKVHIDQQLMESETKSEGQMNDIQRQLLFRT